MTTTNEGKASKASKIVGGPNRLQRLYRAHTGAAQREPQRELQPATESESNDARFEAIKTLLDGWADWLGTWEPIARGATRQTLYAPDARIHSVDDLDCESRKTVVRAVHACVYDLSPPERDVILKYYGFIHRAWQREDELTYARALTHLLRSLSARVAV